MHALQERHKIKSGNLDNLPSKGAIVLLKEDVKVKAQWRIARVTKEIIGKDNHIRGYELTGKWIFYPETSAISMSFRASNRNYRRPGRN